VEWVLTLAVHRRHDAEVVSYSRGQLYTKRLLAYYSRGWRDGNPEGGVGWGGGGSGHRKKKV
jgi:hypothetical protein